MANKLMIYNVEDTQTGKVYKVEGPEGASDDELSSFLESQIASEPAPSEPSVSVSAPDTPTTAASIGTFKKPDSETVIKNGFDTSQPMDDWLNQEEYDQVAAMMADPKHTYQDIDQHVKSLATSKGRLPLGISGSPEQLQAYRDYLAKGGAPKGPGYVDWTDQQVQGVKASGPSDPGWLPAMARSYLDAVQYGTAGIAARTYHDWMGTGEDALRKRFPEASDDQIQALRKQLINATQKKLREVNIEAAKDDPMIPWLAAQVAGSPGLEDFIPGAAAGSFTSRVVKGAGVNALADAGYQTADIASDVQDEYSLGQTVANAGFGAALHGTLELGSRGVNKLASKAEVPAPEVKERAPIAVPTARQNSKAYRTQLAQATQEVESFAKDITSEWTNAPEYTAHTDFSEVAPQNPDALGVYLGDGKVALNVSAITTKAKEAGVPVEAVTRAITYHESLGHHGLAQKFGDSLDAELEKFYSGGTERFQEAVDSWLERHPNSYKDDPNRLIRATEEVFADWSTKGQLPVQFKDRVSNLIKDFARKMKIDLKFSERELKTILAMAHDAVVKGKGRDVAGNGFRFMYVGVEGDNPDLMNKASDFWDRADSGENPATLYRETGFFVGPDGRTRFELNDSSASLREDIEPLGQTGKATLGEVLDHPALFEHYPKLKNKVTVTNKKGAAGERGWAQPNEDGTYTINITPEAKNPLSTLLHEVQHVIQFENGWELGANPGTALKALNSEQVKRVRAQHVRAKTRTLEKMQRHADTTLPALETREAQSLIGDAMQLNEEIVRLRSETDTGTLDFSDTWSKAVYQAKQDRLLELRKLLFGVDSYFDLDKTQKWIDVVITNAVDSNKTVGEAIQAINKRFVDRGEEILKDRARLASAKTGDDLRKAVSSANSSAWTAYRNTFGEIEARDVQARQNYSDQQRREILPYSSENDLDVKDLVMVGSQLKERTSSMEGERFNSPKKPDPRMVAEDRKLRRKVQKQNESESAYTPWGDPKFMQADDFEIPLTPEDVFEIQSASEILDKVMDGYTPQYRDWGSAKSALNDRGISANQVLKGSGIGKLDEKLFQYDALATKMSDKLSKLHHKLSTGAFTEKDKANYLETVFKFNELAARIFDDQGEVGRALNALKAIDLTKRKVTSLQEILSEYKDSNLAVLADPNVFARFADTVQGAIDSGNPSAAGLLARQVLKPYWWQYILSFRHASMLSGLGTHAKNAYDNLGMLARELEESALSVPVRTLSLGRWGASSEEVLGRMYGILRAALDAGTYKNTFQALQEGHGNRQFSSKVEMQDPRIPVVSKVTDALYAADVFFRSFHESANLYALGTRQARNEGYKGIRALEEGSARAVNPSEQLVNESRHLADVALLVDTPSLLSSKLESLKAIHPNMKAGEQVLAFSMNVLFPFFRVTDRLLFQAIRRSPLAFLDKNTRADFMAGGERAGIAAARIMYGSALIAYYWSEAGKGNVTGEGPADFRKRQALESGGWRANSVNEGDKNVDATAVNLSLLPDDTHNAIAANVASIREAYEAGGDSKETADKLGVATLALMSILSSQSFGENLLMYGEAFKREPEGQKAASLAGLIGGQVSAFIPAAARQANQMYIDPVKRDTRGDKSLGDRIKGRIMSGIPGLSQQLPMKYDFYGDPIPHGRTALSMSNYTDVKNDPVSKELYAAEKSTDKLVVSGAPSSFKYEGETVTLNAEAQQEWQRVQGYYLRYGMQNTITTNEWRSASKEEKVSIIKEIRKEAYDATKEYILPLLGLNSEEE